MENFLAKANQIMLYQWWDQYMKEVKVDYQIATNPDDGPEYLSIESHIVIGIKRNETEKSHKEAFRKIAHINSNKRKADDPNQRWF